MDDNLRNERQRGVVLDGVQDVAFGRFNQPVHPFLLAAHTLCNLREFIRIDCVLVLLRLRTGNQQVSHTVGLGEPTGRGKLVHFQLAPALRILRQQCIEPRPIHFLLGKRRALHHAGIAGKVPAEVVECQHVVDLERLRERAGIDLPHQAVVGFHVVTGLGVQVTQHDGGAVVAVRIPDLLRQLKTLLQADLRGVEII